MKLEYVPLLKVQRELQGMPRSMERFREYLRTMTGREGGVVEGEADLQIPLGIINPMAREHVTELLDTLLSFDADGLAAAAVAEAESSLALADVQGEFRVSLVVADDLKGGWTNRHASESFLRFGGDGYDRLPRWLKQFWLTGVLWSSEEVSPRKAREAVLTTVHRAAYVCRNGPARTLRARMAQEGAAMAASGCTEPALDPDDLAYTRAVIEPFLDADDPRTTVECLFGDAAAAGLGFTPRGLSPCAGLALALADARQGSSAPNLARDA
ncbi:MAG: hypothetical protein U0835_10095 [Isosphaeraceae bacterium]